MKNFNKVIALSLCAALGLSLTACKKSYDGTYKATVDITEQVEEGAGLDYDLTGSLEVEVTLTMEKGEYTIEMNSDKFKEDMETFYSDNMDTILMESFGTDDVSEIEEYAQYMGYEDYDALKADMLETAMSSFDDDDIVFEDNGTYTVSGDTIKFDSEDNDDFDGEVDGKEITIEVEDDDAMFGDDLTLVFEIED
jgi:hypothetical protein